MRHSTKIVGSRFESDCSPLIPVATRPFDCPTLTTYFPVAYPGSRYRPVASVSATCSPASHRPLSLLSMNASEPLNPSGQAVDRDERGGSQSCSSRRLHLRIWLAGTMLRRKRLLDGWREMNLFDCRAFRQ